MKRIIAFLVIALIGSAVLGYIEYNEHHHEETTTISTSISSTDS